MFRVWRRDYREYVSCLFGWNVEREPMAPVFVGANPVIIKKISKSVIKIRGGSMDVGKQGDEGYTLKLFLRHSWWILLGVISISVVWNAVALISPVLLLSENQSLYVFSTQAQVLGAIYGLYLTGFIFLKGNQEREKEKDPTLADIISVIQYKEYTLLIIITTVSMLAIFLDLLAITTYDSLNRTFQVIVKNSATCFFMFSIVVVFYFIIIALNIGKVKRISKQLTKEAEEDIIEISKKYQVQDADILYSDLNFQGRVVGIESNVNNDESSDEALLGAFMKKFILLESELVNIYEPYKSEVQKTNGRTPLARIARELMKFGVLDKNIGSEIIALIQYRNAIVHTNDKKPSFKMLKVLDYLLGRIQNMNP